MSQSSMNQNNMTASVSRMSSNDSDRIVPDAQIDPRTESDIEKKIIELAKSYTPEWHYSADDPDIGVTIAKIFAGHMSDNLAMYN